MNALDATPRVPSGKHADVLIVDDSLADLRLTREAFLTGRVTKSIHTVSNGESALRFLRREEPYGSAPRPDLVILDLNMSEPDGIQVLDAIKSSTELGDIPVVILTNSHNDEDLQRASRHRANEVIRKPGEFRELIAHVLSLESRWLAH